MNKRRRRGKRRALGRTGDAVDYAIIARAVPDLIGRDTPDSSEKGPGRDIFFTPCSRGGGSQKTYFNANGA